MFFLIGLGLGDKEDITVRGLNIIKKCNRVYLESYTSVLTAIGKSELEQFYGINLIVADRELVEQDSDIILNGAEKEDVALLVVGDPLCATTHVDIILRARKSNIPYEIVHNASIITAVGCCGLQLYSFGEIISIPFWTETWKPDSFYERILANRKQGLHTLCLLDIKIKEPADESLIKKKREYLPQRFMTVNEASAQLISVLHNKITFKCDLGNSYDDTTKCIGLARIGSKSQKIVYCTLKDMKVIDLGGPLHCLIVPGRLQPLEEEFLAQFAT